MPRTGCVIPARPRRFSQSKRMNMFVGTTAKTFESVMMSLKFFFCQGSLTVRTRRRRTATIEGNRSQFLRLQSFLLPRQRREACTMFVVCGGIWMMSGKLSLILEAQLRWFVA